MTTIIETVRHLIANRVPGPFRETVDLPGQWAARHYLYLRKVCHIGVRDALERAATVALRPHTDHRRAKLWYGNRGGVGEPFTCGRDLFRWIENTEAAGLRFVAWADDVARAHVKYTGWCYTTDDHRTEETLRGGLWQLPGKGGASRLLYGYAEFEACGEMNPGSAVIVVSDVVSVPMADDEWGDLLEADETADAARLADGEAESAAESRRDYDSAYQLGRNAADQDNAALEARRKLLPLLAELRTLRRSHVAGETPSACEALRSAVDSLLETIFTKRKKRDLGWRDMWGDRLEAWRDGFMDESEGGFIRAVRLGYASRDDWQGAPEANPA